MSDDVTIVQLPGHIQSIIMPSDEVVMDAITTLATVLDHPVAYDVEHRIAAAIALLEMYATLRTFDP
jgi:hypothetical protein